MHGICLSLHAMSINETMINDILKQLGIESENHGTSTGTRHFSDSEVQVKEIFSPVDGAKIAGVRYTSPAEYDRAAFVSLSIMYSNFAYSALTAVGIDSGIR